jgi:hypothetical protein
MIYPGFIGASGKLLGLIADMSRMVNLYLEKRTLTGRPALYSWPGQTAFATTPGSIGGRAAFQMNGRTLFLMGGDLYDLAVDGTPTLRGSVPQDGARGYITMNGAAGAQALIASATNAYALNLNTNVLSAAVLTGAAHQIGYLDGYGIAFDRVLSRIRLSNLNDFLTWDPTQFLGRNDAPDNWLAMCVNAPDVWLIGEQTGCVLYDAGSFPFPLAVRPGLQFAWGIAAADSIAAAGDSVLWVSRNRDGEGIVVRAQGYVPQPFSSAALETAIARYAREARIDDAEGLGLQWEGHSFYVLRFPSVPATWFADLTTGEWGELGAWNAPLGRFDAWRARVHCLAFDRHLVADSGSAVIAFLDMTSSVEADGSAMRRLRIPPSLLAHDGRPIIVDRLRLLMQTGMGTQDGQGAAPVVLLRESEDYGQTFGAERQASLGAVGKTCTEVLFTRSGQFITGYVPEIVITDPVPVRIVGCDIEGDNLGIQQQGVQL